MDNRGGGIENSFIIGESKAPDTWLQLLERGLNFIPTPNAWDHHIWTSEVDTILNKITNHIWFNDKQSSRTNNDQEAYQNIRRPFISSWIAESPHSKTPKQTSSATSAWTYTISHQRIHDTTSHLQKEIQSGTLNHKQSGSINQRTRDRALYYGKDNYTSKKQTDNCRRHTTRN